MQTKVDMSTEAKQSTEAAIDGNTNVLRRIHQEMIYERDMVDNNPKYTVGFKEGYEEAVRCMAVVIKQLTGVDVRDMA